jgi:hypothetical protein
MYSTVNSRYEHQISIRAVWQTLPNRDSRAACGPVWTVNAARWKCISHFHCYKLIKNLFRRKPVSKYKCHPVHASLRLPNVRKLSYVALMFTKGGHTCHITSYNYQISLRLFFPGYVSRKFPRNVGMPVHQTTRNVIPEYCELQVCIWLTPINV